MSTGGRHSTCSSISTITPATRRTAGEPDRTAPAETGAGGRHDRRHRGGAGHLADAAADQHARPRTRELLRAGRRAGRRRGRSGPAGPRVVGSPRRPTRAGGLPGRRRAHRGGHPLASRPLRWGDAAAPRDRRRHRDARVVPHDLRHVRPRRPRGLRSRSTSTRPTTGLRRWSATSRSRHHGAAAERARRRSSWSGCARAGSMFTTPAPDAAAWSTARRSSWRAASGWRCTRRATPTTTCASSIPSSVWCSPAITCCRRSLRTSVG